MRIVLACTIVAGCAGTVSDGPDASNTTPEPVAAAIGPSDGFGLQDNAGPYAGMPGFTIERTRDATRCGGVAVRIVRDSSYPIASADQEFAELLAAEYPRGLDFSDPNRQASLQRFQSWVEGVKAKGQQVVEHYQQRLTATADPHEQAADVARIVQVPRFIAGLMMRAEIPTDMRSGDLAEEKQDAFCEALFEASMPLLTRANSSADECAKKADGLTGWWTTVCTKT